MFKGLARFHSRAPRYILSPEEDTWIRLAGPHQTPWEEGTEIKDISLSGISFTAPADLTPKLGEVIKIQFLPPTASDDPHFSIESNDKNAFKNASKYTQKSIASYAITTRIERISESTNLVAIHYYKMDMRHRIALAHAIESKIADKFLKKSQEPTPLDLSEFLAKREFYMMAFVLLIWITFFSFYFQFQNLSPDQIKQIGELMNPLVNQ